MVGYGVWYTRLSVSLFNLRYFFRGRHTKNTRTAAYTNFAPKKQIFQNQPTMFSVLFEVIELFIRKHICIWNINVNSALFLTPQNRKSHHHLRERKRVTVIV